MILNLIHVITGSGNVVLFLQHMWPYILFIRKLDVTRLLRPTQVGHKFGQHGLSVVSDVAVGL